MIRSTARLALSCAASLALLLSVSAAAHAGGIPAKKLKELKAASVYLKLQSVPPGGMGKAVPLTGSGFLVHVAGKAGYIATNNHVVSPLPGEVAKGNPQVVFHSGTPNEVVVEGEVVARDPVRDLALVKVTGVKKLPEPIRLEAGTEVLETMTVYAFGFPFGKALAVGARGPAITITKGTVSSLRHDESGQLRLVQIDADVNPGNSGGPVVDEKGRLVGVAVARVVAAGKMGFAVPPEPLREMLHGKVNAVAFETLWVVKGHAEVNVLAGLIDPLGKVRDVALHYRLAPDVKALPRPDKDGVVPPLKDATRIWLKTDRGKAKGRFTLNGKGEERVLVAYQASWVTATGKTAVSPVAVAAIDFTRVLYTERLTENDPRDARGHPRQVFTHPMKAGRQYVLDMRADPTDLNPRLIVQDGDGKVLAEDDGLGGQFDALLAFTPPRDGEYQVVATTTRGKGPYTLSIRAETGQPVGPKGLSQAATLGPGDPTHPVLARPHRSFNLILQKGKSYRVEVKSEEFDPFVRLENMGDLPLKDEDIGGNGQSTLFFHPFRDGIYRVAVAAYDRRAGRFHLTVRETPEPKPYEVAPQGLKVAAKLTAFDPIDMVNHRASRARCKVFPVKMKGGQQYIIDLRSKQFDPFLRVEDGHGKELAFDDDSGGDLQARLAFTPPADGVYRIIATHFDGRLGNFELAVRAGP
jgi:S1-C subfamily serine protease